MFCKILKYSVFCDYQYIKQNIVNCVDYKNAKYAVGQARYSERSAVSSVS